MSVLSAPRAPAVQCFVFKTTGRGVEAIRNRRGKGIRTVTGDADELAVDQKRRGEDLAEDRGFEMLKWAEGRVEATTPTSQKFRLFQGSAKSELRECQGGGLGIGIAEWHWSTEPGVQHWQATDQQGVTGPKLTPSPYYGPKFIGGGPILVSSRVGKVSGTLVQVKSEPRHGR